MNTRTLELTQTICMTTNLMVKNEKSIDLSQIRIGFRLILLSVS